MDIVDKLKEYLKREDIKQNVLAERLGWSTSVMSDVMCKRCGVGRQRLEHIAKTLGLTFEIGESSSSYPPEIQRYVDKLVTVLTSSDKKRAEMVEQLLDLVEEKSPLAKSKKKEKKAAISSSTTSKTGT